MRKTILALILAAPLAVAAQDNTWERVERDPAEIENPDAKYLVTDAVPEKDGRVVFSTTIDAPGKQAGEIFSIVKNQLTRMTKEENQVSDNSIVALVDETNGLLGASFHEWLVFKNSALSLDRTVLNFMLKAECHDGRLDLTMTRITYDYDLERDAQHYTAEEWITDKYAVNKSHTKLTRLSAKFRRKTIDRKDYIFRKFNTLLNGK